jgi:hypothetical protein
MLRKRGLKAAAYAACGISSWSAGCQFQGLSSSPCCPRIKSCRRGGFMRLDGGSNSAFHRGALAV